MTVRNVALVLVSVIDVTSVVEHVVAIGMVAEMVVLTIEIVSEGTVTIGRDLEIGAAILDLDVVIAMIVVVVRLDRPENWWTIRKRTGVSSENYKANYAPERGLILVNFVFSYLFLYVNV